jgi:hypothetical protein
MNARADHHETLSNQIGLLAAGLNGTSFFSPQLKRKIVIYFVAKMLEKAPAGDNK